MKSPSDASASRGKRIKLDEDNANCLTAAVVTHANTSPTEESSALNVEMSCSAMPSVEQSHNDKLTKKKGGNKRKFLHEYCLTCKNYGRACPGRSDGSDGCKLCRVPNKEKGEKLRDCLWADPERGIFNYKQAREARKEALRNGTGAPRARRSTVSKKDCQLPLQQDQLPATSSKKDQQLPAPCSPRYTVTPLLPICEALKHQDSRDGEQYNASCQVSEVLGEFGNPIPTSVDRDPTMPIYTPLLQQEFINNPELSIARIRSNLHNKKPCFELPARDENAQPYQSNLPVGCCSRSDSDPFRCYQRQSDNAYMVQESQQIGPITNPALYLRPTELRHIRSTYCKETATGSHLHQQACYLDPSTPLPLDQALPQARATIVSTPIIPRPNYSKPRPLDLSGRKSKKWRKHSGTITGITGVTWSLPKWKCGDEADEDGDGNEEKPNDTSDSHPNNSHFVTSSVSDSFLNTQRPNGNYSLVPPQLLVSA